MKSKLFSRGYDYLDFNHRMYARYLQSEMNDQVLSPRSDYYDSEILNLIKQDQDEKPGQDTPTPLVRYTVAPQKERYILPNGKFKETWNSLHPWIVKRIAYFLPLGSIISLMETCRDCFATFENSIWEDRLERRLKIAIKERTALPNLDLIKSLHKNQQFNLQNKIMSSHTLFKTNKIGTMTLARDLVDFQPIKSLGLLQKLRLIAPANLTISLFLSHEVEQNEITLWAAPERHDQVSTLIIRKLQFSKEKQIISCKFINEECFIVQLKEAKTTLEDISCNYEILIFDIYAELIRIENLASDQPTSTNHKISLNFKSLPEETITPIQDQAQSDPSLPELELSGKAPSEFSFCLDPQGRIIFYGQGDKNSTILIYNTKAGKLEKIHSLTSKVPLFSIIIPTKNVTQDLLELLLIFDDLKIEILKYSLTEKTFSSQELNYLEPEEKSPEEIGVEQEEITKFHKYRHGSFQNKDGQTIEYLITLHNKKFYYINLESKSAHKLLTIARKQPENTTTAPRTIEGVNLMDWNIHENILVMTIDYTTLVTLILGSNGQIINLVQDANLLKSFARMPKAHRSEWPYFGNILQTRIPPMLVFNTSYLIIVNFSSLDQNFQIYIIPFQSYLLCKDLMNFEYKGSKAGFEKILLDIRSPDIFEKESFTFFQKINNSLNLPDLVKFEDNKLLIKLNINLFFDLQNRTNLTEIPNSQCRLHQATWDFSVSEELNLLITKAEIQTKESKKKKKQQVSKSKNHLIFFKSNPNHDPENQLGSTKYDPDDKTSYNYKGAKKMNELLLEKYNRKKSFEETKRDLEFEEQEEEARHSGKQKDERKKNVKYFFSRDGRREVFDYVAAQGISHNTDYRGYFLKQLNKKKDDHKKSRHRQREDSV